MKWTVSLLIVLVLVAQICAQGISFRSIDPGNEYSYSDDVSQKYYFLINHTNYTNQYYRIQFSACSHYFDIYGKVCNPKAASCDIDSNIPTAQNNDFSYVYTAPANDDTSAFPRQSSNFNLCGSGSATPGSSTSICSANNYYFFVVSPSSLYKPPVSNNTLYSFKISFFANKNLNAPVPTQVTSSRALSYNANTGRVSWEALTSCSKYNFETLECTETSTLSASSYDVYYYPFDVQAPANYTGSINTRIFNADSICGLNYLYSTFSPSIVKVRRVSVKGDQLFAELPLPAENPKPQKYKYIVNVVARDIAGSVGISSLAYQALAVNDEMVPPPKINLGGVLGGLFATVVVSGIVVIIGCIAMYVYHKKTQSIM